MSKKQRNKSKGKGQTGPVSAAPVEKPVETESSLVPTRAATIIGIVIASILAITLCARIVIDGFVYPYWNFPFLAISAILFTVWAILALLRVCPIHLPRETALLAGFVLWAAIGLSYTVEYDATFRAVLLWASYACVFVLCASVLNSRTAIVVMLGGFAFTAFAEAVWSLVHVQYILPLVRMQVQTEPGLAEHYFGPRADSEDLHHRLQSNRAFGTFLFPNALGAYMALAIPFAAAGALASIRRLREHLRQDSFRQWAMAAKERGSGQLAMAIGLAILTAVLLFSAAFVVIGIIEQSDFLGRSWFTNPLVYWFCVAIVPLVCGGAVLYAMRVYGFTGFAVLFRALAYPLATVVLVITLYAAFTRGAMLALAAALLVAAWLTIRPPRRLVPPPRAVAAGLILCLVVTAGALTAGSITAAAQHDPEPVTRPLDVAGTRPTIGEALSGATFGLRLGYWSVGVIMWWDNALGGVGLGNFGTAYPNYQFIGADDVKLAHNDFLQMLAETGPIGFLLFTGFWVLFFFHGARAFLSIQDPYHRLMAGGLYTSLLAFVLHAGVDFNFANPSLAMPALALAGTYHAMTRAHAAVPAPKGTGTVQLALLIPVLALLAVLAGTATRAYVTDTQLRRLGHANQMNEQPMQAANYILAQAVPENVDPETDFSLPIPMVFELIQERPALESMGMIVAPTNNPQNPWRRVSHNEPLNGSMLLIIRNLEAAHRAARQAGVRRAELLATVDSAYPHRTDVANHLYQWYYLLLNTTQDAEERARFVDACLKWARECVNRSPRQSWHHSFLGNALWEKAKRLDGQERVHRIEEALQHYRMAADLYPLQTSIALEYAHALNAAGQVLVSMGREERGLQLITISEDERRRARQFQQQINAWRHGTPLEGEGQS